MEIFCKSIPFDYNFQRTIGGTQNFGNFTVANRYAEARLGFEWRDADIVKAFT